MRIFCKPAIADSPAPLTATEQLSLAVAEVQAADVGVRDANTALNAYLAEHPNAHIAIRTQDRFTVRLDAMNCDPVLTILENACSEAQRRFHMALARHSDLKDSQEVHYVGGIKQG